MSACRRTSRRDERAAADCVCELHQGQTKVFDTHPMEVTSGMSNSLRTMPLRFSIGLNPLPPGEYNCQVTVLNPDGQKSAFRQTPITLVP
jgi:hypothetical protein